MHLASGRSVMAKNNKPKTSNRLKSFVAKSSGDVWNAVRRLGAQIAKELTNEQFFMSAEFYNYARNLADFLLRKRKLYALSIHYDPRENATIAYTDGKNIVLNAGNQLAAQPKLLEGRFKVNMGILFHEVAHKLFLDFDIHQKGMEELLEGRLFGNFDVPAGSDLETNLQELKQAQADGYKKAVATVYKKVLNIVNDGHDEAAMKRCFSGFVAQCIDAAGLVQQEQSSSLEENVAKGAAELSILYSLMLQYAKFGYCNLGEESDATEPYTNLLSQMEPVIDAALEEDNYLKRWDHINILILQLWPVIKKILEQKKNDNGSSGGGQSGNGGSSGGAGQPGGGGQSGDSDDGSSGGGDDLLSDDEIEEILQALADASDADNSAAPAPQNGSGGAVDPSVLAAAQSSPGNDGDASSLINQIANQMATDEVQGAMDNAQLDAIRKMNRPMVHKTVPVDVNRHHDADEEAYDEIYDEVKPYVQNLISSIQALLREFNEEAIQRHRRYGPIIEACESYRPDGAFFAKKKLPEDRPNMAMCVLVDESGSMGGLKLEIAKKAMVMLERFAAGVGVPLMIAGHCARGRGVELNIYTDFVSARPEQDRYALSAIRAHGCNRDGLPLRVCADMLAQRPEEIRLMVVISDGAPNDGDYGGAEAFDDIKKTVAEFKRKGLLIYGAAIDDDREVIQELYGKGFLSITDLKSLPKTMVRLMRQNIV